MWRHIIESRSTSYIRCFARLTFHRIFHTSVLHVYSYKTPIKKAQPNFLQTKRKPEIILTLFFTISFLLLSTSSATVEFYNLTTLDKMILLAIKVPSSNRRLSFPSILFTDNQWQEAVFEKCKKAGKRSQQRKETCLWTTVETPFLTFSNQFS